MIEDALTDVITASEQMPNIITDASEHLEMTSKHLSKSPEHLETLEAIAKHDTKAGKLHESMAI